MITCTALAIGLHVGTYHFERDQGYQEFNPGIYAVCDRKAAGLYRNSLGKPSAWVGIQRSTGPVDWILGGVTGYPRAKVLPLIVPSMKLGSVRVSLLLPVEKHGGGFHVSYEW